jgi:hypothetical protein
MDETAPEPMDVTVDGPIGASPADSDPLRQYRAWATALFVILLVVALVASAIVLAALPSVSPITLVGAVTNTLVGIAVLTIVAVALGRAEPWAVHAIAPMCVVLVVVGVGRSLVALTASEINIPLEAVGGALVLTRDHRAALLPPLDAGGRRMTSVIVLVFSAVQLLGAVGPLLTASPG